MAIGNLVLTDSVPTDHTFVPIASGSKAAFANATGALTVRGQETLTEEINRAKSDDADNSARTVLTDPQEAMVDGVNVKVGEVTLGLNLRATKGSSALHVKNALAMFRDYLGEATTIDALSTFTPRL